MLELNKIHLGDSRELLKEIDNNSISCIITSPPYKDVDNFSLDLIYNVFVECYRVLKKGGLMYVNFGHLAEDKLRPFRVAIYLEEAFGFKTNETFIWKKNHYKPIQGKRRVNNLTEFVFLFYKEKMPELDRLAIGIPYADKSNVNRFAGGSDLKCRGNVWEIPYDTIQKKEQKLHNDRFPLGLPLNCLRLANMKAGAVVLDPFAGSGTTCLAAKRLGLDYIGIELEQEYIDISNERLR